MNEIKRLKEIVAYKNKFATVYDDEVEFPNGKKGNYIRFKWNIPYGVAIVATNKMKQILLIREYSYRTGKWGWTIPKGMGEYDVCEKDQATAELKQETGFYSEELEHLFSLREIVDTDKGIQFYRARLDEDTQNEKELDDTESIDDAKFFNINEAVRMIKSGDIDCYHSAVAIFYLLSNK